MIPRPRKPTRSLLCCSDISIASSARGFHAQPLAGAKRPGDLRSQRLTVKQITTGSTRFAAGGAAGRVAAALADQREGHLAQRLELAHDAVAAAVAPAPAGAAAQRVLDHAQRELALERLDRRVQSVAHGDVHATWPVRVCARALAAAERLVVGEAGVSWGGGGAEREVVHRALPLGAPERAQYQVGNARGGLDIPSSHGGARARVEDRAERGAYLDRAVGAGRGGDVWVGEDADREQAGRARDRERAVEVALVLRVAAGEVQQEALTLDLGTQSQHDISLRALEHVLGAQLPVGKRGEACSGAPLAVIEHLIGAPAQTLGADSRRELTQTQRAGAVGRQLRAQVGAALVRLAHASHERIDRRIVQSRGWYHDTLLLQAAAVGGHRARESRADVRVVRTAGRKAD